ncbi:hypothetical protein [Duganella sp. BuS-21]|uniref:hypothetical protein n=1 Tax=Duganella sp. BuS-21 TaxID=2943848 RepID=UPI0035A6AFC8
MDNVCTLQVFLEGAWHDAAALTLVGDVALETVEKLLRPMGLRAGAVLAAKPVR